MGRPKNAEEPVRITITINPEMEADLLLLRDNGKFGDTRAEAVETIVRMFLFQREEAGTLDRLRARHRRQRSKKRPKPKK